MFFKLGVNIQGKKLNYLHIAWGRDGMRNFNLYELNFIYFLTYWILYKLLLSICAE